MTLESFWRFLVSEESPMEQKRRNAIDPRLRVSNPASVGDVTALPSKY